jgi:serine/tyrosine/threonine adenylyltransferase
VAISGETIDYGPCAFMNAYDPGTVFSSIDHGGRYAYGNQPNIVQWNLVRFAETLLPLLDPEPEQAIAVATGVLEDFPAAFERHWLAGMRKKLGLRTNEAGDVELIRALLDWMRKSRADFTNTFRELSSEGLPASDRYREPDFQAWHERWQKRLGRESLPNSVSYDLMKSVNPAVIPRNHRVEEALSAAEERDDLSVLLRLIAALASPYEAREDLAEYREPPADECGYRTFCGT